MGRKTRIIPALGPGETYNDDDFLLVRTHTDVYGQSTTTIDRMLTAKRETDTGGWICKTISSEAEIPHEVAVELASEFAQKHAIPVIYVEHIDERNTQRFDWTPAASATGQFSTAKL